MSFGSELWQHVKKEGVGTRFTRLDTIRSSLNGKYVPDADVKSVTSIMAIQRPTELV
ncbi:MAG: hypothetical protein WCI18_04130 [Pseudomonadota bacterium]